MKKALVAAALMAAGVVTAHAQSSVTLYGRLDAGIEYMNGLQNGHQVRAESGDWGTSLWGLWVARTSAAATRSCSTSKARSTR